MKLPALKILAFTLLLSGCATYERHSSVAGPVGPVPSSFVTTSANNGVLLVYSAYDKLNAAPPKAGVDETFHQYRSDYDLLSANGVWLDNVQNRNGEGVWNEPRALELPPGKYRVRALMKATGYVTVPVILSANRITVVQLGDGPGWPNENAMAQSNPVRYDGEIVGWRAQPPVANVPVKATASR